MEFKKAGGLAIMRHLGFILLTAALGASVLASAAHGLQKAPLGLPPVPVPADNVLTHDKVVLGKRLFMDKRFSGDGTISCSTCHMPEKAFADGLPLAVGIKGQKGTRNSPTVINAAYYKEQFWDGRASSLEEQARGPFLNPVEHGLKDFSPIIETIRKDKEYPGLFRKAFGIGPEKIAIEHVVKAIASFERTVIAGDSPFDRYMYGGQKDAMSEAAVRGLEIFRTKARCQDCHRIEQTNAVFTDNKYHNLGVGFSVIEPELFDIVEKVKKARASGQKLDDALLSSKKMSELGRFAVTMELEDIGRFKTPTLRNVAVTGPYMHDGSIETLEEVIELYDQGGEDNPMLDSGIRPLRLTEQEKADLLEFLKALTSPGYESKK